MIRGMKQGGREGRTRRREGGGRGGLPSVILSSEEEERMRKQEISFKGRMKGGRKLRLVEE